MRFERINPDRKEYRFYEIRIEKTLFREYSLMVFWGRIGKPARQRIVRTGPFEEIREAADGMERIRMKRGYEPRRDRQGN